MSDIGFIIPGLILPICSNSRICLHVHTYLLVVPHTLVVGYAPRIYAVGYTPIRVMHAFAQR